MVEILNGKDDKSIISNYLGLDNIDKCSNDYQLMNTNTINVLNNDDDLRRSDISSMRDHNEQFNRLLETYVDNLEENLYNKQIYKKRFFYSCLIILFGIALLLAIVSISSLIIKEASIAVLIANIVSFLTAFIVLPNTIANYLFNNKEEENMTQIIKSIQEHDKEIRNSLFNNNDNKEDNTKDKK